jgi:hypothetical protein
MEEELRTRLRSKVNKCVAKSEWSAFSELCTFEPSVAAEEKRAVSIFLIKETNYLWSL